MEHYNIPQFHYLDLDCLPILDGPILHAILLDDCRFMGKTLGWSCPDGQDLSYPDAPLYVVKVGLTLCREMAQSAKSCPKIRFTFFLIN